MIITSTKNALIKSIAELKDKRGRKSQNAYLVEGIKMVREAITSNQKIKLVIGLKELVDQLDFNGEKIYADEVVLSKLSTCETCQGIFAVIELPQISVTFKAENSVLLDRVRDPGNLGSIIRTSVALGIKNIYLYDCVDAYSPKVVRSSMSGIYSVSLITVGMEDIRDIAKNTTIITADMEGENLFDFKLEEHYCLVMGNEANGVSEEVKALAKKCVSIPMKGQIESLNVGVAYAVIGYQLTKF